MHNENLRMREDREGDIKIIYRYIGPKFIKFEERHESTHLRSSKNCRQDKLKEISMETHYNEVVESQRHRNLKAARDNLLIDK